MKSKITGELVEIIENGFKLDDAQKLNQYLRGELWILLDAVTAISRPIKDPVDLRLLQDFFDVCIQFFLKYLDILPKYLKEVKSGELVIRK